MCWIRFEANDIAPIIRIGVERGGGGGSEIFFPDSFVYFRRSKLRVTGLYQPVTAAAFSRRLRSLKTERRPRCNVERTMDAFPGDDNPLHPLRGHCFDHSFLFFRPFIVFASAGAKNRSLRKSAAGFLLSFLLLDTSPPPPLPFPSLLSFFLCAFRASAKARAAEFDDFDTQYRAGV